MDFMRVPSVPWRHHRVEVVVSQKSRRPGRIKETIAPWARLAGSSAGVA